MAAVLACGLWRRLCRIGRQQHLWGIREDDRELDRRDGAESAGASTRRESMRIGDGSLSADAIGRPCDRIPCTSVARTLLDLAARHSCVGVAEGDRRGRGAADARPSCQACATLLAAQSRPARRRAAALDPRRLHPQTKRTRSEMERLFLRHVRRGGTPDARGQRVCSTSAVVRLRARLPLADAGLIVEADSRRFHDTDSAFQNDRQREQRLQLAGWRVSRCTWEQVEREPAAPSRNNPRPS